MYLKLKSFLPKKSFARGVSVLVGGTASAQAIMLLAAPLLTRIYTPEDFGLLAVYSSLLGLFVVVSSMRYELAIPLPESHTEAANVLILSLLAVSLTTVISGLMVLLVGHHVALALGTPSLAKYFWLLPLGVLLGGIYQVLNYWAIRTKRFGDLATTRVHQTLATLTIQILGFKMGGISLIFGQASGQSVGCIRLAKNAFGHDAFKSWSWQGVWAAARRYKDFPIFSTWSGLFNAAGNQIPPLVFSAFFNAGAAGLYALASRILKLPMTVLGGALGKVYFSNLADQKNRLNFANEVEKGAINLLKLALPALGAFILIAPELFVLVFGSNWRSAGDVARWMTPWILFQFISSPLSVVFFVLEKEKLSLYLQIGMFLIRFMSILMGYFYFDFIGTLIMFSLASAACNVFYIIAILRLSESNVVNFIFVLFRELFFVGGGLFPAILLYINDEFLFVLLYVFLFLTLLYIPKIRLLYQED